MKKHRKILASGGIATTLLLTGSSGAYAQSLARAIPTSPKSSMVAQDESTFSTDADISVGDVGVNADEDFQDDIRDSMAEEGFSASQIQKIYNKSNGAGSRASREWN